MLSARPSPRQLRHRPDADNNDDERILYTEEDVPVTRTRGRFEGKSYQTPRVKPRAMANATMNDDEENGGGSEKSDAPVFSDRKFLHRSRAPISGRV